MGDQVSTRLARPNDLAALIAIDSVVATDSARADAIASWIASEACFLATIDAQPIGYGVLHYHFFGQGLLEMLMVAAPLRGQGIGRGLIQHAMTICRTSLLWATTNQSNLGMQHLLGTLGFVPSGIIEGLDEGDPELVYRIMVKPE